MPSSPKLRYVAREIGVVEIAHQFDSKEFSSTDGYVRIAGEVSVNLERKENSGQQKCGTGLRVVCCPHLIHVRSAVVGYNNLLEQAPEDLAHSVRRLVIRECAFVEELWQEVCRTFNRSCNQLREERYKRKESNYIFGRFYLLTIDIYRIGKCLEGVERNADRQNDTQ